MNRRRPTSWLFRALPAILIAALLVVLALSFIKPPPNDEAVVRELVTEVLAKVQDHQWDSLAPYCEDPKELDSVLRLVRPLEKMLIFDKPPEIKSVVVTGTKAKVEAHVPVKFRFLADRADQDIVIMLNKNADGWRINVAASKEATGIR